MKEALYPSLLINLNGLGTEYTGLFKEIVDTRVKAKKTNKKLAQALKLAVNSLYGLTRSSTSGAQLYDKYLGLDICVAGQVMLYDLTLRLEELGLTIVQVNTDGIYYTTNDDPILEAMAEDLIAKFSKQTNLGFDGEPYDFYFAKDVNNYFILNKSDDDLKLVAQKGVFNRKPYSTNYIVPWYVMEYFKAQIQGVEAPTMEDLWKRDPSAFMIRAKDTKLFDFHFGLERVYTRYSEKTGKALKKPGVEFIPFLNFGKQFRGYAVKEEHGYKIQNWNYKTSKFTQVGTLKTGKHETYFTMDDVTFDMLDLNYYQEQADLIIEKIASNTL